MSIPRECHNHKQESSLGTERRRLEKDTENIKRTYETTEARTKECNKGTASEKSVETTTTTTTTATTTTKKLLVA